jgi:hypothetical protein
MPQPVAARFLFGATFGKIEELKSEEVEPELEDAL